MVVIGAKYRGKSNGEICTPKFSATCKDRGIEVVVYSDQATKPILDVCCGGKMFYIDKDNENVLFCDNRFFETTFDKVGGSGKFSVKPDMLVDFKNLPFESETFNLVIFDPPHIIRGSDKSFMCQKYGRLSKNWQIELNKGFDECMRVLRVGGTLVFKWSEAQISLASILSCFSKKPLIAQKSSRTSHFCIFYKETK